MSEVKWKETAGGREEHKEEAKNDRKIWIGPTRHKGEMRKRFFYFKNSSNNNITHNNM